MINFNNAPEQKTFNQNGPIPKNSIVKVRMTIRGNPSRASNIHPLLTISKSNSNNHYIDCEFEVVDGRFEGIKFWGNYVVSGSEKAVEYMTDLFLPITTSWSAIVMASFGVNASNNWKDVKLGNKD